MGGPDMAPQTPQRSEHPGEAVALLDTPRGSQSSWEETGRDGGRSTTARAGAAAGAVTPSFYVSHLRSKSAWHPACVIHVSWTGSARCGGSAAWGMRPSGGTAHFG